MDISTISTAQAATTATVGNASNSTALTSDFETFLQMLTAQARYQDPLEPLDSSEYASQLAQFSTVEQQVQTNELLEAMVSQAGASSLAEYAGWIGMEARTSALSYFSGSPVTIDAQHEIGADAAYLVVRNVSGAEVQRLELPLGSEQVQWAGVDETGTAYPAAQYRFEVESYANGELMSTQTAESYARVAEARLQNGQTQLILEGGASVSPEEVNALRQPT